MRMPTEVSDGFRRARHLSSRTCMISHRDMHIHTKTFSIFPSREEKSNAKNEKYYSVRTHPLLRHPMYCDRIKQFTVILDILDLVVAV